MNPDNQQFERPNYYSIMPATVRYDKRLKFAERVMFSEIAALSNKYGYCTASNGYFAALYEVGKTTISRWINHLKSLGYLRIEMLKKDQTMSSRRIYLNMDPTVTVSHNAPVDPDVLPIDQNALPLAQNDKTPLSKKSSGYTQKKQLAQNDKGVLLKMTRGSYQNEQYPLAQNDNHNNTRENNTSLNNTSIINSNYATQSEYIQRGTTATSRTADDDAGRQNPTGQSLANAGATASVAQYQQSADQAQPVRSQNQTTRDQQATPMTADDDNDKPTEMEMVFACWREAWGEPRKSTLDDLVAWSTEFEPQLVVLAIRKAVEANADYPDRYIAAVMRGYRTAGIKGYDDAIAADEARKNRHTTQRFNGRQNGRRANVQETLPAWAEPGYKPQVKKPSAEQQDEFKAMIAGMDLESRLRKAVHNRQKLEDADVQATRTNLSQPNGHGYMSVDAPKLFEQYLAQQGQGA